MHEPDPRLTFEAHAGSCRQGGGDHRGLQLGRHECLRDQAVAGDAALERPDLPFTRLDEHLAAGSEPARRFGDDAAQDRQAVFAALERDLRLVLAGLPGQEVELCRRHVRGIGDEEVT